MAQNKQLSLLVLVLLVYSLQIQCIVARHMILDQKETRKILGHKNNDVNVDKATVDNTQSPPAPSDVVGETQAPPPKNANDFRHTSPGHSPGAGHSLQN
ncbi:C-TERMINALLY ENCODED PEPTIDE 5 [Hibiscus trionum]|uniref:C-TERMINALLY ENCODED PEPTIDE 5 n=1 Tax=Hibiscus trionum TaxID=183268 RepID=A0A9W7LKS1_HIBTR|nr:C-TERMINALLY ENCODED PEPTIDE 5 [Hibiscus trionum]